MGQGQQGTTTRRYLYGVQGLRTVAALLVAIYHIWFGRVSGGVDVFFVVAGFFAVGSLARAFGRAANAKDVLVSGLDYLVRTFRRIVPSASVVVLATVVMSFWWMPSTYWRDNVSDAWASLFFIENWRLIDRSADYLQQDLSASPFQQFWALGVNAQFYVFIALLLTVVALLSNVWSNARRRFHRNLIVAFTVVLVVSLTFSVIYTAESQSTAYFNTFARLWEFMFGACAALLIHRVKTSNSLAKPLGWIGLILLLGLGAVLDLSRLLPGFLSLVPVVAALLVIYSSWQQVEPGPLQWKPVLWVADASFAFYLWHWPLLVFYRHQFGYQVSLLGGLAIIGASFVLAIVTTRFIEEPIRKSKSLSGSRVLSVVVSLMLLIPPAVVIGYWSHRVDAFSSASQEALKGDEGMVAGGVGVDDLIPHPTVAREDVDRAYGLGCHQNSKNPDVLRCAFGDLEAERTISLVGGSHSLQWLTVLSDYAEANGYRVLSMTKSGCLFGDPDGVPVDQDSSCEQWNTEVIRELLEMSPDLVVTIGTRSVDGEEIVPAGYTDYFEQLLAQEIRVLAIRDNPAFDFDPPACVEMESLEECSIPADSWYSPLEELVFPDDEGFLLVDTEPALCSDGRCGVVQGRLLVYRDWNHLTTTWTVENSSVLKNSLSSILQGQE